MLPYLLQDKVKGERPESTPLKVNTFLRCQQWLSRAWMCFDASYSVLVPSLLHHRSATDSYPLLLHSTANALTDFKLPPAVILSTEVPKDCLSLVFSGRVRSDAQVSKWPKTEHLILPRIMKFSHSQEDKSQL